MTPTATIDRAELYRAEALFGVLQHLPDASCSDLVTDPPYSSGGMYRGDRSMPSGSKYPSPEFRHLHKDFSGDNRDQRSFAFWCTMWMTECLRIVQPGGLAIVFTDWRQLSTTIDVLQAAGWVHRGIAVWDKTEACRPQLGRFSAQAEYMVWGTNGPRKMEGNCAPGVIRCRLKNDDKAHQTGKPVALLRELLKICGDRVLDPFMGGGSTGLAAAAHGKAFVGVEQSSHYFDVSCERIRAAASMPAISTSPVVA